MNVNPLLIIAIVAAVVVSFASSIVVRGSGRHCPAGQTPITITYNSGAIDTLCQSK